MGEKIRTGVVMVAGVAFVALIASVLAPRDPACVRLQAKVELAQEFCEGLAERAATERCQELAPDEETIGQCFHVVVPAAFSSCMNYLNLGRLEREIKQVCK